MSDEKIKGVIHSKVTHPITIKIGGKDAIMSPRCRSKVSLTKNEINLLPKGLVFVRKSGGGK